MSSVFSFINYFMAGIFVFAAVVQYNDPDAGRWIAIYASAVFGCIAWSLGKYQRWICGVIFFVSLIWIVRIFVDMESVSITWTELVGSLEMKNDSIEQFREAGGLIIVATWMSVLFFKRNKAEK